MPELYFVFTRCSADANIHASTRKRKGFDPFACACAYFASENQALTLKEQYIFFVVYEGHPNQLSVRFFGVSYAF